MVFRGAASTLFIRSADDMGRRRDHASSVMDDEPADERGNAPDVTSLSERERDVLSAALEGLSARAIASRLSLTFRRSTRNLALQGGSN